MAPATEFWDVSTWYPGSTIQNAVLAYQLRGLSPFHLIQSETTQHAKLQLAREARKV